MSGCAGGRYDKKEDFQILLTKNDPLESPQYKNYLWMTRWNKASSSAEPQNVKTFNRLEDVHKSTSTKDSGDLPFEFMKSTVAERLMVGVSRGNASEQHTRQFTSNMRGVVHDVCKDLGPKSYEHGDERFERCIVNLHARAVVSETYSLRKLSGLPLDFQKLGSSDNPSSDCSHFPMFEVNRKIDNILNPKGRSALDPASLNVNVSTSHVMAMSSREYMMHSHQMGDENMDICKSAGGTVSHLSDPAGQKLKGHLSDTMPCSCSKDDNNSSDCQIEEQDTSHYFANSKHEPPCVSSGKKFKFAGNNKNQITVSAFHNQKPRRSAVYKQQDGAGGIFCAPVLGTEFLKEPTDCFNSNKQAGGVFHENYKNHGKAVSNSLLPYKQQHLKTQRTEAAANLNDSCMLPDPIANTLTVNSKQLTHGKESTEKSTGSCKRKGPCLFEMLTTASKSHSACPKNSVSSGNRFDVCMYGTNVGGRLFGTQNQSSARTETLYSDTLIVSKSSAGIASSPANKDYGSPNEEKTEQLATPSIRGDSGSKENGFHNVTGHHDVSSKATIASKQPCMPGAGTTNLDLILFQMSRMKNPISSGIVQPPIDAEPSDRWLKRLQVDISDPEIPSSKRSKVLDNEEMIDRVKEDKILDEGSKLKDKQEIPPVPAKSMNCWIGRWCEGGTPAFRGDPGQRRQGTKAGQAPEELGGQFPSIAAMAMMGRAMNKLRPCEHQKKVPFVVWKTD